MSVTITVKRCTSEGNRITKSFTGTAKTFTGTFKDPQNLLHPVVQIATTDDLSMYNYCTITEFGRSYFVSMRVIQNGIWELNCSVDVLSTYAAGIKASKALVKRTNKTGMIDYYMNDDVFYTEQRQVITYHTFKKNGTNAKLGNGYGFYLLVAGG